MSQNLSDSLDANQTLVLSFDASQNARRIVPINSLIPTEYDSISLTYITSGNGIGEIGTVSYSLQGDLKAILSLVYDDQSRLTSVIRG